eukprot:CAMPEP_0184492470 /NCGR_PEP_ID=MMETSP0113_2-20130426/23353_1 /TAXON_ID=91329 /ORGANISM="Norrisiella sphaerica, Strain BC52" /LENGTH=150 /DNA_ID=CAMNT_0026877289 /DNA_START=862 /DNA_END=1314 /DNA_ORIENTATION=+
MAFTQFGLDGALCGSCPSNGKMHVPQYPHVGMLDKQQTGKVVAVCGGVNRGANDDRRDDHSCLVAEKAEPELMRARLQIWLTRKIRLAPPHQIEEPHNKDPIETPSNSSFLRRVLGVQTQHHSLKDDIASDKQQFPAIEARAAVHVAFAE